MPSDTTHSSHSSLQSGAFSSHSQTSTLEYGHETFETFRTKVGTLCRTLWPLPNVGFEIQRGSGGSYNRIVEITADHQFDTKVPRDLILRIPRFERMELQKEITALRYIKQMSNIPVPDVVAADLTADNVLETPYSIQKRIPGISLQSVYPNLSHRQQLTLSRVLWNSQLMSHKDLTITQADIPESPLFLVRPFEARSPYDDREQATHIVQTLSAPAEGVLPFLHSRFQAWKEETLEANPNDYFMAEYYDRLAIAATGMSLSHLLGDNVFTYCHMDLAPRNVLVSIHDSDLSILISGVLDWDDCGFAPKVFSCIPASWLWAWVEDESEDEKTAGEEPPTENAQQLKKTYEESVGKEFLKYCYGPHNRMARTLVRLALRGIHSNEEFKDADAYLEEWDQNKGIVSNSSVATQ